MIIDLLLCRTILSLLFDKNLISSYVLLSLYFSSLAHAMPCHSIFFHDSSAGTSYLQNQEEWNGLGCCSRCLSFSRQTMTISLSSERDVNLLFPLFLLH